MTKKQEQEYKEMLDKELKKAYTQGLSNGYLLACNNVIRMMNNGTSKDKIKDYCQTVIRSKNILNEVLTNEN